MIIKFFCALLPFLFITSLQAKMTEPGQLSSQLQKELSASPIGDNINVSIYDFILAELMKHQDISKARLLDIKEQEKKSLEGSDALKSYTSEIIETQFSHILTTLCKGTDSCHFLALYQKDGLLIGFADPYENWDYRLLNNNLLRFMNSSPKTMAFLEKDCLQNLGIQKINCNKDHCDYLITWAIYRGQIRPNNFVGDVSFLPPTKESDPPIGFLRIIKRIFIPQT